MTKKKQAFTSLKHETQTLLAWGLRLTDVLLFVAAAHIAYFIRHNSYILPPFYSDIVIYGTVFLLAIFHLSGLYKFASFYSLLKQLWSVLWGTTAAILGCVALLFFMKQSEDFSRLWMFFWLLNAAAGIVTLRLALLMWFWRSIAKGAYVRRVIIMGDATEIPKIITHCQKHNMYISGIHVLGGQKNIFTAFKNLKTQTEILRICIDDNVDDIILAADLPNTKAGEKTLHLLRQMPCSVRYCLPEIFIGKGIRVAEKWDGLPLVTLYRKPMLAHHLLIKRIFDVVCATAAIILLAPVFLLLAAIIRLSSNGPAFYVQTRNGFGGSLFGVFKFRSMTTMDSGTGVVIQATKNDPRITKIGRFLRKSNLDELPQLFNVLKGDMSLVGPRPHAVSHNSEYENLIDSYAARHRMKPGITGWAQVNGLRGETDTIEKMEARVAHDLYYIENWSLALDIKILFMTIFTFLGKNAY